MMSLEDQVEALRVDVAHKENEIENLKTTIKRNSSANGGLNKKKSKLEDTIKVFYKKYSVAVNENKRLKTELASKNALVAILQEN